MNRIDRKFKNLKKQKKKAFIAYITAGDPSLAMTGRLVLALEKSGADIIELGIPFSDPIADGPTIQAASQRALKNSKVNLKDVFGINISLRVKTDIPIVFMTYFNPVLKYGLERFFKSCEASGVDGVIIPDLPPEEAKGLIALGKSSSVSTIFLIAPTSTRDRIKDIAKSSSGFIYYVSLTGVTGAREKLPTEILSNVRLIKSITDKPVAVGFGVSSLAQAKRIAEVADGVIIGSAIVKLIGENRAIVSRVSHFAKGLSRVIHNV